MATDAERQDAWKLAREHRGDCDNWKAEVLNGDTFLGFVEWRAANVPTTYAIGWGPGETRPTVNMDTIRHSRSGRFGSE